MNEGWVDSVAANYDKRVDNVARALAITGTSGDITKQHCVRFTDVTSSVIKKYSA